MSAILDEARGFVEDARRTLAAVGGEHAGRVQVLQQEAADGQGATTATLAGLLGA